MFIGNVSAWPFLVSRNLVIDYTPVVAPPFLIKNKHLSVLIDATQTSLCDEKVAYYREVSFSSKDKLSIVFSVKTGTQRDIGTEKEGVLKDNFDREILMIWGIVLDSIPSELSISLSDFTSIHSSLIHDYRSFWTSKTSFDVIPSSSILLQVPEKNVECIQLRAIESLELNYSIRSKSSVGAILDWHECAKIRAKSPIESITFTLEDDIILIGAKFSLELLKANINYTRKKPKQIFFPRKSNVEKVTTLMASSSLIAIGLYNEYSANPIFRITKVSDLGKRAWDDFQRASKINSAIRTIAFGGKNLIASGYDNGNIDVWDTALTGKLFSFQAGSNPIRVLSFSPNCQLLASGDIDGNINVWDINLGINISQSIHFNHSINLLDFSDNQSNILAITVDTEIILLRIEDSQEIFSFNPHKGKVNAALFVPNSNLIASCGDDSFIYFWNMSSKEVLFQLDMKNKLISSIAFNKNGSRLAAVSEDWIYVLKKKD